MTDPVADAPRVAKTSLWEDFVDIFYAPSSVFERRRDGRFWPALIVYGVGGLLLYFLFRGMWEAVTAAGFDAAMRNRTDLTPEQVAGARAGMERFGMIGGILQSLVFFPLAALITGLLIWLIGKIFGGQESLGQAATIAAYSNIPRLLGLVVAGALFAAGIPSQVASPFSITLSPIRFVDEATISPIVGALLSRFDVFTIWTTVLLAIGLRVMGRLSTLNAALVAAITWLLATGFAVASTARQMGG